MSAFMQGVPIKIPSIGCIPSPVYNSGPTKRCACLIKVFTSFLSIHPKFLILTSGAIDLKYSGGQYSPDIYNSSPVPDRAATTVAMFLTGSRALPK